MSKFLISDVPVRLTFPDGEWVDFKAELTQEDSDYIVSKMVRTNGSFTDKTGFNIELGKLPLMERSIVAWSFVEDGKPLPVTRDNISSLQGKYRTLILSKINELSLQANEFQKN